MDREATRKARISVLQEEVESINRADQLYSKEMVHTHPAKAEYYRRQDRLEEIRRVLNKVGIIGPPCKLGDNDDSSLL
jgi:hypothetical protein